MATDCNTIHKPVTDMSPPHVETSTLKFLNPFRIFFHLLGYRYLISQMTRREVAARYKGSFLGLSWSFIQPLMMLGIYTFVFSLVFKAKWGVTPDESRSVFALTMFMGIITFNILGESLGLAPSLILGNVNYVKKVVFPLEILPLTAFLSVLINALFSLFVLLLGLLAFEHQIPQTALLLPLVWLSPALFSLGFTYFLASLGVFIRDIGNTIGVLTTMLFFMSPIFYPVSSIPENLRFVFKINPIAIFVEDARRVVLWGTLPDWHWYLGGLAISLVVFMCGFIFFMKSKRAFADVI